MHGKLSMALYATAFLQKSVDFSQRTWLTFIPIFILIKINIA